MSPDTDIFVISLSCFSFYSYVPLLVQLHQKWRRLYRGFCLGTGFRTVFEMAHLRHTPKQFNHLKGLLDVFKDKLVCMFIVIIL
jgi:Rab3 GTPase-activating protein catalytic subunit